MLNRYLIAIVLSLLLGSNCISVLGQMYASKEKVLPDNQIPVHRWLLSFNPLGLVEWPGTVGLGVGYRMNERVELWSETSFLGTGAYNSIGYSSGFKQVVQAKFFFKTQPNLFWALEARYKSFQTDDSGRFVNAATKDTLYHLSSFGHHYFFGGAFQMGFRKLLSRRFQTEFSFGIGLRKYASTYQDAPAGFKPAPYPPIDFNFGYSIYHEKIQPYFPGSVRLIFLFGKRLRP